MRKVFLVLGLVLSLVVAGCGGASTGSPDKVVDGFFAAYASGNVKAAAKYLTADLEEELVAGHDLATGLELNAAKAWYKSMKMKPTKTTIDGDTATVSFEITMPDVEVVFERLMAKMLPLAFSNLDMTEEEMNKKVETAFLEIIRDKSIPKATYDGEAQLVKDGGVWKIGDLDLPAFQSMDFFG